MNESAELVLDGGAPIGQQIAEQIRRLVQSGVLHPGEELPTVRAIAVGLAVSPHAVEEAYDRLAQAGLLARGESSGPRVADPLQETSDVTLKHLCENFLREAYQHGYQFAAVVAALQDCHQQEVHHVQAH
jgi:GntR family transcriptional regulator